MVVCKCRKATKLYCFVHKVPVCGECICFPEHQLCVIRTYSEWVIDGEYDWPPKCCHCQAVIEGTDPQTTRLGCLHVIHTSCLVTHIKSFPPHTAPAGYVCPECSTSVCSTSIWPPKSVKDSGSRLHSKLKEAIVQTGLEKNLFGNHPVSFPGPESRSPPPAFASNPLMHADAGGVSSSVGIDAASSTISAKPLSLDIIEINGPDSAASSLPNHELNLSKSSSPSVPGATTRKSGLQFERQSSEVSYYADDEDGNQKKYSRRGTFRHKLLRSLLPFWSSALPTLPVTAPPRKDASNADDIPEGRPRHHRSSRMDPRKLLLIIAIMACMATMGILYYRIAQRGLSDELPDDEKQ